MHPIHPGTSLSDVLRRLLMVIGCVVLATAQPMSTFGASTEEPKMTPDTVIYPKAPANTPPSPATATKDGGSIAGSLWISLLLLGGGGAWWWWKNRLSSGPGVPGNASRKLTIEETRALGNRQYLVVASYDGRKYLLGVTQGQISLLTALGEDKEGRAAG